MTGHPEGQTHLKRRAKPRKGQQLSLPIQAKNSWGGRRKGAGRKPKGVRAGMPHRRRPSLATRMSLPVHVTLRMAEWVWNLRSQRSFRIIERALAQGGAHRFGVRVVQFSVQGNHIHLLVESTSARALSRAIKGLSIRVARGLNQMIGRRGQVLGDRYHSRVLRTPTEVRYAIRYVRDNHRKHMAALGERVPSGWVDPYSSESPMLGCSLPEPASWLLAVSHKSTRARR